MACKPIDGVTACPPAPEGSFARSDSDEHAPAELTADYSPPPLPPLTENCSGRSIMFRCSPTEPGHSTTATSLPFGNGSPGGWRLDNPALVQEFERGLLTGMSGALASRATWTDDYDPEQRVVRHSLMRFARHSFYALPFGEEPVGDYSDHMAERAEQWALDNWWVAAPLVAGALYYKGVRVRTSREYFDDRLRLSVGVHSERQLDNLRGFGRVQWRFDSGGRLDFTARQGKHTGDLVGGFSYELYQRRSKTDQFALSALIQRYEQPNAGGHDAQWMAGIGFVASL